MRVGSRRGWFLCRGNVRRDRYRFPEAWQKRATGCKEYALHRRTEFTDATSGVAFLQRFDSGRNQAGEPAAARTQELADCLGAVLLTDVPMMAYGLEGRFRIPYRFDQKNSYFGTLKAFDRNVEIETVAHDAAERPPVPLLLAPGAPPPPTPPPPPRNIPDVRSMQFHFRYSVSELPPGGYRPRLADDRVAHFLTQFLDGPS